MIKTIRIVKANAMGYAIINESDFDPGRHVLYDAPVEVEADKPKHWRKPKGGEA